VIEFPITELLNEEECYKYLLGILHPEGLKCPCGEKVKLGQAPHTSDRAPIVEYRCRKCGKVFNIFTNTMWSGTHYDCRIIVLLIRGYAQGAPSLHLAKELQLDYETVLNKRHQWQASALKKRDQSIAGQRDGIGRNVSKRRGERR